MRLGAARPAARAPVLVEDDGAPPAITGPAAPRGEAGEREVRALRGAETVLLVDDDGLLLRLTGGVLAEAGYTVLEARGGTEALVVLETWPEPIHLLLTDFVMPDMDGLELTAMASVFRPTLPALLVSAYSRHPVLGDERSNRYFLERPFTRTALLRKVREILDARR